ncbi:allantoinase [Eremomyces bilateralis CBS 781.70]|uniref:Allantoinase n=1 Tax=Eremomyces bilateralis CBS 781.70 TaxID=1392243 RepID=A0A6G1FYR4_9PEZI|nr:allantoinase [Eremomyces bilateralis CBS 781.70]KAF1810924.1 allantoinase [Eremomyces bilateralis CBS 781.70]
MASTTYQTASDIPSSSPPPVSPVTVLASSRAVVDGRLTEATIVISTATGKISSIFHSVLPPTYFPAGTPYVDHSPHILIPGLVDAHVHLNEPGRTEWEGFWHGTRAAAFGGVTTVVDMPLNAIPPTTTVDGFREKIDAAQGKCWVDVGFYGGIIPGNEKELIPLVKAGVRGFKGFLIDSGVPEFPAVSAEDISKAFQELADQPTTAMFHAEMIPPVTASVGDDVQQSLPPLAPTGSLTAYRTFLDSRPPSFETYAIEQIVSLAHLAPNLPLHIVHLSATQAIPILRAARADGINITAETCFHYLSLAAEEIADGDTRHKCCPPIREQANQDVLWDELQRSAAEGVIKTVVSDHSPCTPNLKILPPNVAGGSACVVSGCCGNDSDASDSASGCVSGSESPSPASSEDADAVTEVAVVREGNASAEVADRGDFFAAWGGISSVGLGLPILWTEAQKRGGDVGIEDVVEWCCRNTAKQVGLLGKKGDLAVGYDGDVAVFDDCGEFTVEHSTMLFRNKCSPYEGLKLKGVVKETWLRGRKIHSRTEGFGENVKPVGRTLLEPRTY